MAAAQRVLGQKQLVFCVTNGRSGSKTLARLLDCLQQVQSQHEPAPSFHLIMRWAQNNAALAENFWLYQKLPAIAECHKPIYLETSHLFAKGFIEPLLELGGRPKIIFLSRDPRATAMSMLMLNDIPGRTRRALKWYLSPSDALCAGLRPGQAETFSDYQLCYWHALEMQARQKHYSGLAAKHGLTTVTTDVSDLNSTAGIEAICGALAIDISAEDDARLRKLIGIRENTREQEKTASAVYTGDLDAEEEELRSWIIQVDTGPKRSTGIDHYISTAWRGL
ncbi:MAG: hypothetical protein ACERJ2_06915 [Filomicrobium sp.]